MKLNLLILDISGTITSKQVNMPRYRKIGNAVVMAGAMLRKANPNIAAIKAQGYGPTWVGNASPEQLKAADKAAKNNLFWNLSSSAQ